MNSVNFSGKKLWITVGALVAAMVLCICGIVSTSIAVAANQPTNVMLSAVQNLISAKNLKATGAFELNNGQDNSIKVTLTDAEQSGIASSVAATIDYAIESQELQLNFAEAFIADGVLYLKIEGVADLIKNYYGSVLQAIPYAGLSTKIENLADTLDGTWWRVSIEEILEEADEYLSKTQQRELITAYNCILDEAESLVGQREKYFKLYEAHPFIVANRAKTNGGQTATGDKYTNYTVQLDAVQLTDFYNQAVKATDFSGLNECLAQSDITSSSTVSLPEAELNHVIYTVEKIPTVTVGITDGQHQLAKLSFSEQYSASESTQLYYSADLNFEYPAQANISAPSDAQPITELYTIINDIYTTFWNAAYAY